LLDNSLAQKPVKFKSIGIMRLRFLLLIIIAGLIVVGCNSSDAPQEPVILVATDPPPDANFVTYTHDTGVFSIRVPPNWVIDDLPDDNGVRVQFSTLEDTETVTRLSLFLVNTGSPMTREAFLNAANTYQPPSDVASFEWQPLGDPIDQPDGSRRVLGIRDYPLTGPRALNIFMQGNGSYFSALEVDITDANETALDTLTAAINTYRVNADVSLDVGQVVAASTSFTGDVGFEGFTHWSDADGGFNITGRVVNLTDQPLEAIRMTGYLFDSRGNDLSEKSLIITTDLIMPSGNAPFRLRFEGGRPSTAVRYELHAAARTANLADSSFYGAENFTIEQNPALYNDNGHLVLSGRLANVGSRLAQNVKVVVAVLDDASQVVASETVFIDRDQLLPGEVGNYEVVIFDIGGPAISYELTVMGTAE
jgi:hypothetical protein